MLGWLKLLLNQRPQIKARSEIMKTLEEYMKLPYKLEIVPDTEESGFVASYPELPGCITCGDTIEAVVINAEDAKKEWLKSAITQKLATTYTPSPTPANELILNAGEFVIILNV